jgi:hypothetical protein
VLLVCITLQRFAVLAQCMFQGAGGPHLLVDSLWSLASSFQNQVFFITEQSRSNFHVNTGLASTYHARILRHVQLRAYNYLQSLAISVGDTCEGVEVPRFQALLRNLKDGTLHHCPRRTCRSFSRRC